MYYCIMYSFETKIRVRYSDTDQMGFVYYGEYAKYYEIGRVELLRSLGIPYKKIEEEGFILPVVSFNIRYKYPAFYDDTLSIKTTIKDFPSTRIAFYYEIINDEGKILNIGDVELAFLDKKTNQPCRAPDFFMNKLKEKVSAKK